MLQLQAQTLEQQERVYKNQIRLNIREILQGELNFYSQVGGIAVATARGCVGRLLLASPKTRWRGVGVGFPGAFQHQLDGVGAGRLLDDHHADYPRAQRHPGVLPLGRGRASLAKQSAELALALFARVSARRRWRRARVRWNFHEIHIRLQ